MPVDSILLAVFTVSPKRQYLGIFSPTTPAQTGPLKNDIKATNVYLITANIVKIYLNVSRFVKAGFLSVYDGC